jgi:hypothetical protein
MLCCVDAFGQCQKCQCSRCGGRHRAECRPPFTSLTPDLLECQTSLRIQSSILVVLVHRLPQMSLGSSMDKPIRAKGPLFPSKQVDSLKYSEKVIRRDEVTFELMTRPKKSSKTEKGNLWYAMRGSVAVVDASEQRKSLTRPRSSLHFWTRRSWSEDLWLLRRGIDAWIRPILRGPQRRWLFGPRCKNNVCIDD